MNFKGRVADQSLLDKELAQLQAEQTIKNQLAAAGDRINQLGSELEQLLLSFYRTGLEANHRFETKTPNNHVLAGNLTVPRFDVVGSGSTVINRPIDLSGYRESPPLVELIGTGRDTPQQRERDALQVEITKLNAELAEAEMQSRAYLSGPQGGDKSAQSVVSLVQSKKSELAKASMRLQQLQQLRN